MPPTCGVNGHQVGLAEAEDDRAVVLLPARLVAAVGRGVLHLLRLLQGLLLLVPQVVVLLRLLVLLRAAPLLALPAAAAAAAAACAAAATPLLPAAPLLLLLGILPAPPLPFLPVASPLLPLLLLLLPRNNVVQAEAQALRLRHRESGGDAREAGVAASADGRAPQGSPRPAPHRPHGMHNQDLDGCRTACGGVGGAVSLAGPHARRCRGGQRAHCHRRGCRPTQHALQDCLIGPQGSQGLGPSDKTLCIWLAASSATRPPHAAVIQPPMKLLRNTSRGRACGGSATAGRRASQAPALSRPSLALLSRTQSSTRLPSHNERLELALGTGAATDVQAAAAADAAANEPAYDVLGLAQAMVDISAAVEDGLLAELGVERGCRRCVGGAWVDGGA